MDNLQATKLGRIGVLMGGTSSERDISLKSGKAVSGALKASGCQVLDLIIDTTDHEPLIAILKEAKIDIAFIALHGRFGEDGTIQAILEDLGIVYTGSGIEASRLAINKARSQEIFKQKNIPVPEFEVIRKNNVQGAIHNDTREFPVIVKPSSEGSSIGITLVEKKEDLLSAITKAFEYDEEILVETYIKGRELTVGILDEQSLAVAEIRPKSVLFDFSAKYESGTTEYLVPAPLEEEVSREVQQIGLRAHRALGCRDFSRVDIRLDQQNRPFVLEVNTIPGFTATSLLPKAAKATGIDFPGLCLKLVGLAYAK